MAIYTEETDPNEKAGLELTERELTIDAINDLIQEHGEFTIADVDADHSPYVESKGKLIHLMEEFREGGGTVRVYAYSYDEIDEYDEFYEELEDEQLEYILELAQRWAEINEE